MNFESLQRDEYGDLPKAQHHLHEEDMKPDWGRAPDPSPVYVPVVDRETGEVLR